MKLRNIFVFTHDSIGLGEDGPTHQPVEQTASLRLIPNMDVWRPCDTVETAVAWTARDRRARTARPACILSRQNLPFQKRDAATDRGDRAWRLCAGGGGGQAQSGDHRHRLGSGAGDGRASRTGRSRVSRSAWCRCRARSLFDAQDAAYRASVLPAGVPRVAIEAGVTDFWRKYVGAVDAMNGAVIGIDRFGESAPAGELFKYFGFTVENVVSVVKGLQ